MLVGLDAERDAVDLPGSALLDQADHDRLRRPAAAGQDAGHGGPVVLDGTTRKRGVLGLCDECRDVLELLRIQLAAVALAEAHLDGRTLALADLAEPGVGGVGRALRRHVRAAEDRRREDADEQQATAAAYADPDERALAFPGRGRSRGHLRNRRGHRGGVCGRPGLETLLRRGGTRGCGRSGGQRRRGRGLRQRRRCSGLGRGR